MKAIKLKPRSASQNKSKRTSSLRQASPSIPLIKKICEKERDKLFGTIKRNKAKSSSKEKSFTHHAHTISNNENSAGKELPSISSLNKLVSNAKDLLITQNSLIDQFSSLTKKISQSELEIDSLVDVNQETTNNFTSTINSFKASINAQRNRNEPCPQCEKFQNFILSKLNDFNELIGKLGYNYVFHKFKPHNFNMENIEVYFTNAMNLLVFLNNKILEAYDIIQKQSEQIKNYELNMVSASNNTNIINKSNNENVSLSSQLFSSNTFTTNKSGILSHLNTMTNNNGNTLNNTTNNNTNNNINVNINNNSTFEKTSEVTSSNLFDSGSFFEGYKRNKEMRTELELEHHYTDGNSVSQNFDDFKDKDVDVKMSTYNPKRSNLIK